MCIIAKWIKKPDEKTIKNCYKANSDGVGLIAVATKGLYAIKGLMSELDTINAIEHAYKAYKIKELYAHFRLATHGGKSRELTHPFLVSRTAPLLEKAIGKWQLLPPKSTVLLHNGIASQWDKIAIQILDKIKIPKYYSDTTIVAQYLATIPPENIPVALSLIGGKYAVISASERYLIGDFQTDDGDYYSNGGYKNYSAMDWGGYNSASYRHNYVNVFDKVKTGSNFKADDYCFD